MKHEGYNLTTGNPSYHYEYSGKELQKETGWSDFGARMYMSDIARWGVIDPLAETTTRVNPYNYALDNPVMYVDPDGRKAQYLGSEYELFGVENSGIIAAFQRQGNGFGDFSSFLGDGPYFYKGAGSNGGGGVGDGDAKTFGETDLGKKIMAFIYFRNINFNLFDGNRGFEIDKETKKLFSKLVKKEDYRGAFNLVNSKYNLDEDIKGRYTINFPLEQKTPGLTGGDAFEIQEVEIARFVFNSGPEVFIRIVHHEFVHVHQKGVSGMVGNLNIRQVREFLAYHDTIFNNKLPNAPFWKMESYWNTAKEFYKYIQERPELIKAYQSQYNDFKNNSFFNR